MTETISNKHSYCHASAIGVSRILLEYDKTTEKWDVLSFDRMWYNIGSWGELDHVTIELQRVGEYDYLLHESTWYNTTFYDIFYSEQGDRLQIETGDQRCGYDEDDIFLCWFYNTEISIDEGESTITFQKKTTLEYERGNEYVYETSVYKVIDGEFIKQE